MFGVGKGYALRKRSFRRPIHGFIPVKHAVVVDVHPAAEIVVFAGLDLDVDEDPLLLSAFQPDFQQFVDETPPDLALPHDFLELFVEWFRAAAPVDLGVGLGAE